MAVPAAAAGSWTLGDLTVHRLGFGAMRLVGPGGWGEPADGRPYIRLRACRVVG